SLQVVAFEHQGFSGMIDAHYRAAIAILEQLAAGKNKIGVAPDRIDQRRRKHWIMPQGAFPAAAAHHLVGLVRPAASHLNARSQRHRSLARSPHLMNELNKPAELGRRQFCLWQIGRDEVLESELLDRQSVFMITRQRLEIASPQRWRKRSRSEACLGYIDQC